MPVVRTLLVLLVCAPLALADHELRTLSGKTVKGNVLAISPTEIVQQGPAGPVKTPLAQVLAVDLRPVNKAADAPHTLVRLLDDSLLRCGQVVFKGNQVEMTLLSGQVARAPLGAVVWFLKDAQDQKVKSRWDELTAATVKRDRIVILKGGELNPLEGTLGDIDAQGRAIQFRRDSGDVLAVPLAKLHGIIFYRSEAPAEAAVCTVFDAEGDSLAAARVAVEAGTFRVTTAAGVRVDFPEKELARLDYNRGKLSYLSDMEPAKVIERSGAGLVTHYRKDLNLDGQPIRLAGAEAPVPVAKGLSLHAHTELEYDLAGKYKDFKAILGLDPSAGADSQALVTIECDGARKFSGRVSAKATQPIALNVRDVRRLRIIVSSENVLDLHDHATLAEARVSQ